MGSIDPSLLVVEGKLLSNVPMSVAEEAIWEQLVLLCKESVASYELDKVKNKSESTMVLAEMAILEKAMNLAYFELLGDADGFNRETERYLAVQETDIQQQAQQLFTKENSSTLVYLANAHAQ